jgi:ABC-type glycerol-3-phosphate transport system substrate-binding protein
MRMFRFRRAALAVALILAAALAAAPRPAGEQRADVTPIQTREW